MFIVIVLQIAVVLHNAFIVLLFRNNLLYSTYTVDIIANITLYISHLLKKKKTVTEK